MCINFTPVSYAETCLLCKKIHQWLATKGADTWSGVIPAII